MNDAVVASALEAVHHISDDEPPWGEILARTSRLMRSDGAVFLMYRDGKPVSVQEYCVEGEAAKAYVDHFSEKDILIAKYGLRRTGQWFDTQCVLPPSALERNEYYVDFMCKYRMPHLRSLIIEESPSFSASISFHRAKVTGDDADMLTSAPVLQMQLAIQEAMARKRAEKTRWLAATEGLFEALGEPILLVNAAGYLVSASRSAIHALEADSALRLKAGRLWHPLERVRAMLAGLLQQVAASKSTISFVVPGEAGASSVVDLACVGVSPMFDRESLLLLRLRRRSLHGASLEILCGTYALTKAEGDVLAAIVAGKTPKQIALDHGVTLNTVRKQVAMILQKTGCTRQMDLVRLASGG